MAILAFTAGLDIQEVALYLIFLILAVYGIISWSRRAKFQYAAGARLNALFSAALVLFMLALLLRAVMIPVQNIIEIEAKKEIPVRAEISPK
jgi:TRAP-type C4-dicarboxylate transport system permease small subunit